MIFERIELPIQQNEFLFLDSGFFFSLDILYGIALAPIAWLGLAWSYTLRILLLQMLFAQAARLSCVWVFAMWSCVKTALTTTGARVHLVSVPHTASSISSLCRNWSWHHREPQ